jgi:RluA family pseudouridine synthase
VPPDSPARRIDAYLSGRFTYLSRTEWRRQIEAGKISINGRVVPSANRLVRGGDIVRFDGAGYDEPEVDENVGILYEDDTLLGVDKTGNLPVHPSGRYFNNTLLRILEPRYGRKLYPVHRLDRETSGVILFAKNREAASAIQGAFHRVSKSYIAIVHGMFPDRELRVDAPLGFDTEGGIKKRRLAGAPEGERALTRFRRILYFSGYSLVKAFPETGRLHQVRAHLQYAGYPIVGDKMYGRVAHAYREFIRSGLSDDLRAALEFPRSALHSRSLAFFHPVDKTRITIKAPVPGDFRTFIAEKGGRPCPSR